MLEATYAYCREDVLKLVDECDQSRIVDVDPASSTVSVVCSVSRPKHVWLPYELELDAIFG